MPRHSAWGVVLAFIGLPAGADELVVATWGGAYERVQKVALFEPFEQATGISIRTVDYGGDPEILRTDPPPDVIDMRMSDAIAACENRQLRQLSLEELPPGADDTPARDDFIGGALEPCAVTHTVYSTVLAYDLRAFPGRKPDSVEDFFDLETFPGTRALRREPAANLEWGLLSYQVPTRDLYTLLSTQRGLDLAFRRLDGLAGSLIWWSGGEEPVELLESGEVVMASGYNGRFFDARVRRGSPIQIIWDGQLQELEVWAIPARAARADAAWRFIRFATRTEPLTELAERIAYGPARRSAQRRVTAHPDTGIDVRPHIPTHPYNSRTAITKDTEWYARVQARIQAHFDQWLETFSGTSEE